MASVNVATIPVKLVPSVGEMFTPEADSAASATVAIAEAEADIEAGRTIPAEQVMTELARRRAARLAVRQGRSES